MTDGLNSEYQQTFTHAPMTRPVAWNGLRVVGADLNTNEQGAPLIITSTFTHDLNSESGVGWQKDTWEIRAS